MSHTRFAIYFLPPNGPLADFGTAWFGWDVARGRPASTLDVPGLERATRQPRKYGFHATLKPPFHLANGTTVNALKEAVAIMAANSKPAKSDGLQLTVLGRFLALTPIGDTTELSRVAATCVEALDPFRAPLSNAEMARRRKSRLSEAQDALLMRWGYPYVMDAFRFHMTLTGRLPVDDIAHWTQIATEYLPALPAPFDVEEVALVGEREDGYFELIQRYPLTG